MQPTKKHENNFLIDGKKWDCDSYLITVSLYTWTSSSVNNAQDDESVDCP